MLIYILFFHYLFYSNYIFGPIKLVLFTLFEFVYVCWCPAVMCLFSYRVPCVASYVFIFRIVCPVLPVMCLSSYRVPCVASDVFVFVSCALCCQWCVYLRIVWWCPPVMCLSLYRVPCVASFSGLSYFYCLRYSLTFNY